MFEAQRWKPSGCGTLESSSHTQRREIQGMAYAVKGKCMLLWEHVIGGPIIDWGVRKNFPEKSVFLAKI